MDHKERTDKENKAIDILAKKLRRTLLRQEPIAIGNKQHKFDFASKDGLMVGEVKTSEPNRRKPEGPLRSAVKGDLCRDCLLMLAVKRAKRRILVLTNKTVYEKFMATQYGQATKVLRIEVFSVEV